MCQRDIKVTWACIAAKDTGNMTFIEDLLLAEAMG